MKIPCGRNCKDREVGCHGRCAAYQEYDEWRKEVRHKKFLAMEQHMMREALRKNLRRKVKWH